LLKEIIISIQAFVAGHRLIRKHGNWKWIWIPGIIYAVIFALGLYLFYTSSSRVTDYLMEQTNIKNWLQSSNGLLSFLFVTTVVMINLLVLIFYFSLFKYLFLIVCSPIFSFLSEKTQSIIEGREVNVSAQTVLKGAGRGIRIALKNFVWQFVYFLALILLSFIPVIGWITPVIGILVECYYYGFSMMDYACLRNGVAETPAGGFIAQRRGLAIGNGMMFYLMHLVPVIGWIFAPVYAVVAPIQALKKLT
jgi:CysZ protein